MSSSTPPVPSASPQPPPGVSPGMLPAALAEKLARLRAVLADSHSALVCFSGGVDSMLLLHVAHEVLGARCVAMTAASETMAASERRDALALGARGGGPH